MKYTTVILIALFVAAKAADDGSVVSADAIPAASAPLETQLRGAKSFVEDVVLGREDSMAAADAIVPSSLKIGNEDNDQEYDSLVHELAYDLEKGKVGIREVEKKLKKKYKEKKFKVNKKKKMLKDAALKALEKNKNKQPGEITDLDLVRDTLSELSDEELRTTLQNDLDAGYAVPEDPTTIDDRAGEHEDMEMDDEFGDIPPTEEVGRRLGVPVGGLGGRWPDGVVRYTVILTFGITNLIDPGYSMWAYRVLPAMIELEEYGTLTFEVVKMVKPDQVKADGTVYLRKQASGCSAHIGAANLYWPSYINIGDNCSHGSILHELLHCAGMHHQQVAWYRDLYVTVNYENVQQPPQYDYDRRHNFGYPKLDPNQGFEFLYDYGSLMHYGEYAFQKMGGGKTIDCRGNGCGQRGGPSRWDMLELYYYYAGYYRTNKNVLSCSITSLEAREQDICISGHNMRKLTGVTKERCCASCYATAGCKGIEWFTANVSGTSYKAGDCMLASSAAPNGCNNSIYKVKFYAGGYGGELE